MRGVAAVLVFALSILPACSSGTSSGGASTGGTPPSPQRTKPLPAGADGYVFTSGTTVVLGREEKAPDGGVPLAAVDVELVASPAGEPIATSPTATAKTDAKGFASFNGVTAGLYRLRVKAPSGAADFALTLVGGATVRWGAYPVSRAKAYDTAKAQVAAAVRQDLTFIASPQTPLPAGVIVAPAMGNDAGERDASVERKVPKAEWFFYVDPYADQKFQHPTKFVFVDAETGAVTTKDASSWPALNGHSYYGNPDLLQDHPDALLKPPKRVARSEEHGGGAPRFLTPILADHVPGCSQPRTYALLIGGADEGPINADVKQIKDVFGHGGVPPASVRQWTPHAGSSPIAEVQALWGQIKAEATACDHLFVFISSHGTRGGAAKLETDKLNRDGTPVDFESFTARTLDWANCKACHITIIIDACYSGRMLNEFKAIFTPLTGRKVVVMASSDERHESGSYAWYNPRGRTGGAFTNAFMDSFNGLATAGGNVDLGKAFDNANTAVASTAFTKEIREQNPQYWARTLAPGETCATVTSSATPSASSSQVANRPPKITRFYASFSRPTTTYNVEASDPDGDTLTYSWSFNVTCGTTAGGNSTTATWSHPDRSIGGNCPDEPVHPGAITVTVSDGKGGSDSFTWTRGSDVGEVRP